MIVLLIYRDEGSEWQRSRNKRTVQFFDDFLIKGECAQLDRHWFRYLKCF